MPTEEAVATPVESSAPAAEVSTGTETVESTPSAPAIQDNADWSDEQFISQALDKIGKPEEQTAETPAEPAEQAAEVPAEEKPAEESAEAEKPAEEKQAEEPALDLDEPIAPSVLEQKINGNPELKAILEKDPSLRGEVFKAARLAQETYGYREVFPDVAAAKLAANDAYERRQFEASWNSGPKGFIDSLVEFNTIKDANGNPVKDANGHIQVDPSLTAVLDFIGNNEFDFRFNKWLNETKAQAEREGNDELTAALGILAERKQQSGRRADEEVPEHIKTREAALKAKEEAFTRQEAERIQAERTQAFDTVISKVDVGVNKLIDPLIDKSALSDFAKKKAKEEIHDRLTKSLDADREYQSRKLRFDSSKKALTDAEQGEYVALVTGAAQAKLPRIIKEVMQEAAKPVISAQQAKDAKVAAQQTRSQQELRGASTPASQKPLEGQALLDKITADYSKEHPGETIDNYTLLLKANEYKQNLRKSVANR